MKCKDILVQHISIDTQTARALPGVHAVWTAQDVADIPPIDFRLTRIAGLNQ